MKIEYEVDKREDAPVAIMHNSGCLIIQLDSGCVAFGGDGLGSGAFHKDTKLSFWSNVAAKKFYPGDKITITF